MQPSSSTCGGRICSVSEGGGTNGGGDVGELADAGEPGGGSFGLRAFHTRPCATVPPVNRS
eukprot:1830236-Prymnesium_polylepis.3